ncbi:hypothetical protein vseg_009729 [Gypsophila vaccaria]
MALLRMETSERKRSRTEFDEEDDEVKMEKFFAIIRKANDIREQLMGIEPSKVRGRKTTTTTKTKEEKGKGVIWQPCFEPEDFGEEGRRACRLDDDDVVMVDYFDVVGCCRTSQEHTHDDDNNNNKNNININKEHGNSTNMNRNINNNNNYNDSDKNGRIKLDLNLSL